MPSRIAKQGIAAALALAFSAAPLLAQDEEGDEAEVAMPEKPRVKVLKREKKTSAAVPEGELWWSQAIVLQPALISSGTGPGAGALEYQRVVDRMAPKPSSVAFGFRSDSSTTTGDAGLFDKGQTESVRKQLVVTAKYHLYLMRSFHFTGGAGFRSTSTKETYRSTSGVSVNAEKSASNLGFELAVGNRWVLPFGLVLGGTWLEVFVPAVTLSSKDADIPAGYDDDSGIFTGRGSRKSDKKRTSIRLVALDLGWAF